MRECSILGKNWEQISRTLDDYSRNWDRCRKSVWSPGPPLLVRRSVFVENTETDAHYTYWTGQGEYRVALLFLDVRHSELDWTCRIGVEALAVGGSWSWSVTAQTDVEEFAQAVLYDLFKRPPRRESKAWSCPACGAVYDIAGLESRSDGTVQCQNCNKWVPAEPMHTPQATEASTANEQD